jgi:aminoglycoside phosphotransferase (APT) family kinase protein
MSACLRESEGLLDVERLSRMWATFRELPREAPDVMSHGDLIPGNVLVAGGHLAGVLDVGCFGAADPALDLIGAYYAETNPVMSRLGRVTLERIQSDGRP